MAEYIKRDDALRQVLLVETRENMFQCIKNLPAADVVVRKIGKWIHDTFCESKMPIVKCSECGLKEVWYEEDGMGFALHGQKYANFCPNCGAKMIGGDDDV